jgi:hypothetical protein
MQFQVANANANALAVPAIGKPRLLLGLSLERDNAEEHCCRKRKAELHGTDRVLRGE